jgi:hypothetical protein
MPVLTVVAITSRQAPLIVDVWANGDLRGKFIAFCDRRLRQDGCCATITVKGSE